VSFELPPGFHRLSQFERLQTLADLCQLTQDELGILQGDSLDSKLSEHLIENAIGYFPVPLGVAVHFVIDGKKVLIPMAVEETSVIAAASATAKWIQKQKGTLITSVQGHLGIGQIHFPEVSSFDRIASLFHEHREALVKLANACVPGLVARGGGVQDIVWRIASDGSGSHLVLHVLCDSCDAMGANLINQICESLKPSLEQMTGERVGICVLSNLVDTKLVSAKLVIACENETLAQGIVEANLCAQRDPYRAATHNKGILNGIDPIVLATGNDWRAVEAGAHAYAARSGRYEPLTHWSIEGEHLVGTLQLPLSLGICGGMTKLHPTSRVVLKILGVSSASELGRICVAVGLVQNLAALKALVSDGIVKGHMKLHASNLAMAAGASPKEIPLLQQKLIELLDQKKPIHLNQAKACLDSIRLQKDR
jgi:hydroxymethylglutaryl-CoA reductase